MRPYRILHEDETHFIVHAHGDERPLKVAKGALRHTTVERIRNYADGGEVEPSTGAPLGEGEGGPNPLDVIAGGIFPPTGYEPPPTTPSPPAVEGVPEGITRPPDALPDGTPAPVIPAAAVAPQAAPGAQVGVPGELGAGVKQELSGIQGRAQAAQAEGNATTQIVDKLAQDRARLADTFAADLVQHQQKADALVQDIQSGKIDPNRLWNSMGTGQKIGASIGLILGGIGAGLTRGPNYALQVIERATDRDLEAQKLELGKKENLLGYYMQKGRDAMAAHQMAKADLLDIASAQLQKVAAQYQGQKAAADAQIASGQLRQQAAVMRQQATERSLQIAQGKLGLEAAQYQQGALRELMKGVSGGGGFNSQVLELPAFKEYRERAVHLPDGSVAFAKDKEEASKATESFATVSRLKAKLQRMRDMLKSGNPATIDRGAAKAIRADLLSEVGHLHDLNRLSDRDLQLFEDQVPDLTDLIKPNASKKLDAFGKSIDDKVWSINQAVLHRPNTRRPGG